MRSDCGESCWTRARYRCRHSPSDPQSERARAKDKKPTTPSKAEAKANGTESKPDADKDQALVIEIRRHLHNARKAELAACRKLYELRHRVESQGKDWWEFYEAADISSRKEAERLMQIEKERTMVIGRLQKVI